MDIRCFSRDFLSEFIEMFKSYPCLWKIKSKDYSDRNKKEKAYEELVAKMKEVEPGATREAVQKKINSLRNSWRKEMKKVKTSKTSGAAEEEIYVPHLWYFDLLLFLEDQEMPRQSVLTLKIEDDDENNATEDTSTPAQTPQADGGMSFDEELSDDCCPTTPFSDASSVSHNKNNFVGNKRSAQTNIQQELLSAIKKRFETPQPGHEGGPYQHLAQHWAIKMNTLNPEQRVHAEKLINDVFYEAQWGHLGPGCQVITHQSFIPQQQFVSYNRPSNSQQHQHIPTCVSQHYHPVPPNATLEQNHSQSTWQQTCSSQLQRSQLQFSPQSHESNKGVCQCKNQKGIF